MDLKQEKPIHLRCPKCGYDFSYNTNHIEEKIDSIKQNIASAMSQIKELKVRLLWIPAMAAAVFLLLFVLLIIGGRAVRKAQETHREKAERKKAQREEQKQKKKEEKERYCPYCGAKNSAASKYCGKCGKLME